MDNTQPIKHVCGQCHDEWLTEAEYLAHTCPATSANPTQPEHQGPEFVEVQRAALERGKETALANGDEVQAARNDEAIQQLDSTQAEDAPATQPLAGPQVSALS